MALKTTIGPKGVVTENIAGTQDQLVVDVETPRETVRNIVSGSGTIALTGGTTLLIAPVVPLTCSLPALSVANEGTFVRLLLDSNGDAVQLSGATGNGINGTSLTLDTSGSHGVVELIGTKANDNGLFRWTILTQRQ